MKKEYSSIFKHYYGLKYDNNVEDIIKVHQLMEDAGIVPKGLTKAKLDYYPDKRPFKYNYFISKVGYALKWCPTKSCTKVSKMTLMPAEWWIAQLTGVSTTVSNPNPTVGRMPEDWLQVQMAHHLLHSVGINPQKIVITTDVKFEEEDVTIFIEDDAEEPVVLNVTEVESDYDELPF